MLAASDQLLWFTHVTTEYEVRGGSRKEFVWMTDSPKIKLDWDNCTLDVAGLLSDGSARFVIRSSTNRNSDYMGDIPVKLRYMLALHVDPATISEPRIERNYSLADSKRRRLPYSVRTMPHDRWVFDLGRNAQLWEWTRQDADLKSSRVQMVHDSIQRFINYPERQENNTIRVAADRLDEIIPVTYQPAVDSLDNFLRETHCHKTMDGDAADVEVSLMFNNEQLRKFKYADGIYRWFRKLFYGRQIDIETFRIHFVRDRTDENYFVFQSIYSGDHDLEYDTIHLDKEYQKRQIEYYFMDYFHPVVFVNTSNHAMAGHDNNPELWKWEYLSWVEKAPVVLGKKSRSELDRQFKSFFG
jgi:hypothetical protein